MVEYALLKKLIRSTGFKTITLTPEEMADTKEIETKVDFNDDNTVTIKFREEVKQ